MALSNIFREPRREITETVVGIGVAVVLLLPYGWADVKLANLIGQGPTPVPFLTFYVLAAIILLRNYALDKVSRDCALWVRITFWGGDRPAF